MSRYDYRDPGQDPEYCAGLEPDDDDHAEPPDDLAEKEQTVPKTSEMRESKFLKQEHVGKGLLLTVVGVEQRNVAKEDEEQEKKWCLLFEEEDKPLVMNQTNIQLAEMIFGSDDTDHWTGKKVVLYVDPTITFGSKVVGGIRMRKPKAAAVAPAKPVAKLQPVKAVEMEPPLDAYGADELGDVDEDTIPF